MFLNTSKQQFNTVRNSGYCLNFHDDPRRQSELRITLKNAAHAHDYNILNFGRLNGGKKSWAKKVDFVPLEALSGPGAPDPDLTQFHLTWSKHKFTKTLFLLRGSHIWMSSSFLHLDKNNVITSIS